MASTTPLRSEPVLEGKGEEESEKQRLVNMAGEQKIKEAAGEGGRNKSA